MEVSSSPTPEIGLSSTSPVFAGIRSSVSPTFLSSIISRSSSTSKTPASRLMLEESQEAMGNLPFPSPPTTPMAAESEWKSSVNQTLQSLLSPSTTVLPTPTPGSSSTSVPEPDSVGFILIPLILIVAIAFISGIVS